LLALLIFSGCGTTIWPQSKPQPIDPPSCPRQAFEACQGPIPPAGVTLGDTEPTDAGNRARWLACIERHNAGLQCLAELVSKGYLRRP
jgi:hypothetical protein